MVVYVRYSLPSLNGLLEGYFGSAGRPFPSSPDLVTYYLPVVWLYLSVF